ncbi:MAG: radical SAM protein [Sedimentisphaerales bacterium]|nr:radical SAM protein [Sedimentisphaerales bacterium]
MKLDEDWQALFDQWKQRIGNLIQEHPLQIISWEATRRCNLRCRHCGSPSEDVDLSEELTTREVIGAFEQIAQDFDMGQFRHINITGGEPFVRDDLLNILSAISAYPFYRNIDIQTNGVVLADNPDLLDDLKTVGVTGLGVSIDGLEASHDSFRRRPGCFAKAFEASQKAVESGYTVTVSVVAHSGNVDEIPELFELVRREIRPRVFRVMTIDPIGRAELDEQLLLSPAQLRQAIGFLQKEYQDSCTTYSDPSVTMVELGCGGWLGKELEGTLRPMIFHCIAGITNLGILYDGKLASCSNIPREFIEGDLRTESIKDVWENRYRRYRDPSWRRMGQCADCYEWDYCHGGPMHRCLPSGQTLHCIYHSLLPSTCPVEHSRVSD